MGTKQKKLYEKPCLIHITSQQKGYGEDCSTSGSNASTDCLNVGSFATECCENTGNNAYSICVPSGDFPG